MRYEQNIHTIQSHFEDMKLLQNGSKKVNFDRTKSKIGRVLDLITIIKHLNINLSYIK